MAVFLTLQEAASVLSRPAAAVYRLIRQGDLPGIKINGPNGWRLDQDDVYAFRDTPPETND
ncbi:MAG: helix-turn-helix domain-containing protein [Acidothermaceae bacterium]